MEQDVKQLTETIEILKARIVGLKLWIASLERSRNYWIEHYYKLLEVSEVKSHDGDTQSDKQRHP